MSRQRVTLLSRRRIEWTGPANDLRRRRVKGSHGWRGSSETPSMRLKEKKCITYRSWSVKVMGVRRRSLLRCHNTIDLQFRMVCTGSEARSLLIKWIYISPYHLKNNSSSLRNAIMSSMLYPNNKVRPTPNLSTGSEVGTYHFPKKRVLIGLTSLDSFMHS